MAPGIFANSADLRSPTGCTQTPVIYKRLQAGRSCSNGFRDVDRLTLTVSY